jgi:hypothetical protein
VLARGVARPRSAPASTRPSLAVLARTASCSAPSCARGAALLGESWVWS